MKLVCGLFFVLAAVSAQEEDTWQKYIVGPQSKIVYPKSIVSTSGNVTNPENLLSGETTTTFTRAAGDEPPSVILDFGYNLVGYLFINFVSASTNTPGMRVAFSETLQFLSDVSDFSRSNSGSSITPGSDQIAVANMRYKWSDYWGCRNGTQICSDGIHGFRYIKLYLDALESDAPLVSPTGTVDVRNLYVEYMGFLATNDTFKGWFECSDEELNTFWYSGVYTNDMTTDIFRKNDEDPRGAYSPSLDGKMVLFDGAKRDRDPYVGDVAVSGLTSYLSHGNLTSAAAKNLLGDLADHQRSDGYIPPASIFNYTLGLFDYSMWWVISVQEYVLYTGDLDFLNNYYPAVKKVLDGYYPANTNSDSGLLTRPSGYGDYAFVGRDGVSSYYNALYVLTLQAGAACAEWVGDSNTTVSWRERADRVSEAVNAAFWDDAVGAYRNSDDKPSSHPQDANSIAILAGIADSDRANRTLNYLSKTNARPYGNSFMDDDSLVGGGSQRVYAFISTFEIRARFSQGDATSALDEIRRLHRWMLTHDPNSTFWEGIGADGSMYEGGFTSAAHGWSTGVVGLLTNYILGVTCLEPGGLRWRFSPVPGDVEWASGQVSTIGGPIGIAWGDFNSTFLANLSVPEGTSGRAELPAETSNVLVRHNERDVWKFGVKMSDNIEHDGVSGRIIIDNLQGGRHVITVTKFD